MTAEFGHDPNSMYTDQQGNLHLNGGKIYDANELDITANVNLASVTATATELNKLAGVTAGTVTASKALVVNASSALDALNVVSLSTGAGAGTAITATSAEINKLAGVTAGTNTASKALVVGASNDLNVLTVTTLTSTAANVTTTTSLTDVAKLLRLSPKPTDTYSATMTIDVTYSHHVIAGANGTSATVAFTPSAAGTAGDILVIQTSATVAGTVTATFASTFHSSGTQATTGSHFSTIMFVSDGTQWNEVCRTTALA